jgi:HAD superfamily hydrolase (TIGR01509 family)
VAAAANALFYQMTPVSATTSWHKIHSLSLWRYDVRPLQALIFDVDGTLADTERDGHRVAFNAAFAEAGLDWHWSEALYGELLQVTGGKERIARYMERHCPGFVPPGGQDKGAFIAALHAAKTRHYVTLLGQGGVPLRPGVARLLREARDAGVRLAIATTTTPENVTALLDHVGEPGLATWFETIAAGDVVPRKKPAPDIFLLALEQLGLKAEECAAIEDSDNGAMAALGAGLKTLIVTLSHYTREQDFGCAALIVDTLGEAGAPGQLMGGTGASLVESLAAGGAVSVDLPLIRRLHEAVWQQGD